LYGAQQRHHLDVSAAASAGQVVQRSRKSLQDGPERHGAAETLGKLVADVARAEVREDEDVGLAAASERGALAAATEATSAASS